MAVEETLDAIDLHYGCGQYHKGLHTRQFQHLLLIVFFSFQEAPLELELEPVFILHLLHLVPNGLYLLSGHCELVVSGNRIPVDLQGRA
jgi:hypothetical protein